MIHVHLESIGIISIWVISTEEFFKEHAEFSDSIAEEVRDCGVCPVVRKHFPVVDKVDSVIKYSV